MAYGLMADVHLHLWSAFSTPDPDGMNSRLRGLLDEIERCAREVKARGGKKVIIAGDLFHTRGSIAPQVLNSLVDRLSVCYDLYGTQFYIMAGNHDATDRDSERLGNAITSLDCHYVRTFDRAASIADLDVVVVPWIESITDLKEEILRLSKVPKAAGCDLILHAPLNGVITGIPDIGLDPTWLAGLGFRRVFVGHYHHHVQFHGGVWSIGAPAHHTWGDVGTSAGFVVVSDLSVEHIESALPKFVDITPNMRIPHITSLVKGNYARVRTHSTRLEDVAKLRQLLTGFGALGTVIINVKAPTQERTGEVAASVRGGASVEQSIGDYIKSKGFEEALIPQIQTESLRCLAEAEVGS